MRGQHSPGALVVGSRAVCCSGRQQWHWSMQRGRRDFEQPTVRKQSASFFWLTDWPVMLGPPSMGAACT